MQKADTFVVFLLKFTLHVLILHEMQFLLFFLCSLLSHAQLWHLRLFGHLGGYLYGGVRTEGHFIDLISFVWELLCHKSGGTLSLLFLLLFLLQEVEICAIKDDFLDFFFRQQAGEKVAWVGLADSITTSLSFFLLTRILLLCAKHFSIGLHFFLQDQKVHHLVKHSGLGLLGAPHSPLIGHLGGSLPCIHLE